jgi:hypothetical protein
MTLCYLKSAFSATLFIYTSLTLIDMTREAALDGYTSVMSGRIEGRGKLRKGTSKVFEVSLGHTDERVVAPLICLTCRVA